MAKNPSFPARFDAQIENTAGALLRCSGTATGRANYQHHTGGLFTSRWGEHKQKWSQKEKKTDGKQTCSEFASINPTITFNDTSRSTIVTNHAAGVGKKVVPG
jgi:hypothetical protein